MTNGLRPSFPEAEVDEQSLSASKSAIPRAEVNAWQKLLDRLTEWGQNAGTTDEDGFQFPTTDAVRETYHWLKWLKEVAQSFPQRVVAMGDGGIAIEFVSSPQLSVSFEVDEAGKTELLLFRDCKLVTRQPAPRPPSGH